MTTLEKLRAEVEHWESDDTQDEYQMGAMDMQNYVLRVIDKYAEQEPSDDVISRQAVLDCATLITSIPTEDWDIGDWVCIFRDRVSQLPSVRPQEPISEQWQELKETILEMRDNDGTGTQQEVCKFLANLMNVLEKQMQEPKTGHWIEKDDNLYECSECGQYIYSETEHDLLEFHAFCGRCGARMVEPQESEEEE